MNSYIAYLTKRLLSSVSFYVVFLLSLSAFALILVLSIQILGFSLANLNVLPFIFLFIFGSIFSVILSLNIFKSGEEDGTELLIVSKPISRTQIVVSKFIILVSWLFIYSIFIFLTSFLVELFLKERLVTKARESGKELGTYDIFLFSISVFLGNFIVLLLTSSLIVLLSSFFGKVATLLIGTLIPTIVPIVSLVLEGIAPVKPPSVSSSSFSYFLSNSSNSVVEPNVFFVYDKNKLIVDEKTYTNEPKKLDEYSSSAYYLFSPFNVWLHFRGLYSLAYTETAKNENNSKFSPVPYTDFFKPVIKLDNKNYGYLFSTHSSNFSDINNIREILILKDILKFCNDHLSTLSPLLTSNYLLGHPDGRLGQADQLIKFLNSFVKQDPHSTGDDDPLLIEWGRESGGGSRYISDTAKQVAIAAVLYLQNHNSSITRLTKLKINSVSSNSLWEKQINSFVEKDNSLVLWKHKELAPINIVLPVYIFLTILLLSLVIVRFYFRDFK